MYGRSKIFFQQLAEAKFKKIKYVEYSNAINQLKLKLILNLVPHMISI